MKNEQNTSFTVEQLKSSLRTGSILAELHSACSALEQLAAQILTTSAPENISRKQNVILETAGDLKRTVITLVTTCINIDKDLVRDISENISKPANTQNHH